MTEGDTPAINPSPATATFEDHAWWMAQGSQLDQAGLREQALAAFEKAHVLSPMDVNTASACATLLSELDYPRAAYRILLGVEPLLLQDADGAANLAIAAESCGDLEKAQACYARALELDPAHLRSLNNVGVLAASLSHWELAITLGRRCIELQLENATWHANLAEYLTGARRYQDALESTRSALAQFPDHAGLTVRRIALMAFTGELESADAALGSLDTPGRQLLGEFLLKLETAVGPAMEGIPSRTALEHATADALHLYVKQAFRNLSISDWRHHKSLGVTLQRALPVPLPAPLPARQARDWGNAPFLGLVFGMHADELLQMEKQTAAAGKIKLKQLAPFKPGHTCRASDDARIRVGIAVQSLDDPRHLHSLGQQLAMHDGSRFALHVYAFTAKPQPSHQQALAGHATSVNELGHMTEAEAIARIRLDKLDLYIEAATNPAWSRPEIAAVRVAPVQLRRTAMHGHALPGSWDYSLSDSFVHPRTVDTETTGAVIRLPHTCWSASPLNGAVHPKPSREKAGLPTGTIVLSSWVMPRLLEPETFAAWMKILRSLPDAVLWLPFCGRAGANLVREARAAGVGHHKLVFSLPMSWPDALAVLGCTDLLLDTLHINAAADVEAALRLSVPALGCAGNSMASRIGGSVLRAAGLPQCVMDNPQAYIAEAVRLGRDPGALRELRDSLPGQIANAPLFDMPARVAELETAWQTMVDRSRAGLAPASFDVPFQVLSPAH